VRVHTPSADDLVAAYLSALGDADIDAMLRLFAPGATVDSPLYGERLTPDFYRELFADTAASVLSLRTTLTSGDGTTIAFWFDFDWTLADGTPAPFSVVDVAELDENGRITRLTIVYDTHPLRDAWDAQRRAAPHA